VLSRINSGHLCVVDVLCCLLLLVQVVLSRRVAAQCFSALYVEKWMYRMVVEWWLYLVASTALLFAHDVGIGMVSIIRKEGGV
jgi:hypothetical protein